MDKIERAGTLMDIVQKVASVAPAYTALASIAMMELKEMNDAAQKEIDAIGAERLRKEQEAAAELNRQNQEAAKEQARIDAERKAQQDTAPKPITVMPGEPVPDIVRQQAGEVEPKDIEPRADVVEPNDAPVTRRV